MIDLVIVVQGKLHKHSLDNLGVYLDKGIVVLAYNDAASYGLPENPAIRDDDLFYIHEPVHVGSATYNQQNCFYQWVTTLAGIQRAWNGIDGVCDETLVLKVRSDKFLGNLDPFIRVMQDNPDRLTCSNLHFRPDSACKFHCSDKFVGGRLDLMRETFRIAKMRCQYEAILLESGIYDYSDVGGTEPCPYPWYTPGQATKTHPGINPIIGVPCEFPHGYVGPYPEVILATSFLMAKGIRPDRTRSREQMRENFRIVRVEECTPYINKWGTPNPEHNWTEIHRIEDI